MYYYNNHQNFNLIVLTTNSTRVVYKKLLIKLQRSNNKNINTEYNLNKHEKWF